MCAETISDLKKLVDANDWDVLWKFAKTHDINTYLDENGDNLLAYAVTSPAVYLLPKLPFYLDPNHKNYFNHTPVTMVSSRYVDLLGRYYCCINFEYAKLFPDQLDALFAAIYMNDISLIDMTNVDQFQQNDGGWTPLMCAVVFNRPASIFALAKRFPDLATEISNKNGYTALMLAAKYGHVDCIHALAKAFPAIMFDGNPSPNGLTGHRSPFRCAVSYDNLECIYALDHYCQQISLLSQHQAFQRIAKLGYVHLIGPLAKLFPSIDPAIIIKAFLAAAQSGQATCVRSLFEQFTGMMIDFHQPISFPSGHIQTFDEFKVQLYLEAATNNHPETIRVLHECFPKANLSGAAKYGKSVLMIACIKGYVDCIRALHQSFPNLDVNFSESKFGLNALMSATTEETIIALYECFGSELNINAVSRNHSTALILAAERGSVSCIAKMCEYFPHIDVNIQNNDGNSALSLATLRGYAECVDFLFKNCPLLDPSLQNATGDCVLSLASKYGTIESLRIILSHQTDLSTERIERAFLQAVTFRRPGSIITLRQHIPELAIKISQNSQLRALHIATTKGYFECVTLIFETFPSLNINQILDDGHVVMSDIIVQAQYRSFQLILQQFSNQIDCGVVDHTSKTVLMYATLAKYPRYLEPLLDIINSLH